MLRHQVIRQKHVTTTSYAWLSCLLKYLPKFIYLGERRKFYEQYHSTHYICILSIAFVGCYEDCDKMHSVYNIKFVPQQNLHN
jgi:uncharacterized Fe-S cluster-containing radical SAM superfamily protein